MQLFLAVSEVNSSRGTLSVFQFRLLGAMPGEEDFGVGVGLFCGTGEDVPFERAPFAIGVDVPLASFCSFTTCRHREMISAADLLTSGSNPGAPLTLFTILPIPVARRTSSLGRRLVFRSRRMVRIFSEGSFAVMAFWRAAPLERISRRSMARKAAMGRIE